SIIRTTLDLYSKFLSEYLNSFFGQKLISSYQAGGNREGLSVANIKVFSIPLPPLPEQKKIAQILSTVDSKIDLLENKRSEYQQLKKGMMQVLLTGEVRVVAD
ncbi:MAG: restriction endonuclease subunit S, partial [Chitinophagales bacterium]